jgi:thymidylate synthase ThyX
VKLRVIDELGPENAAMLQALYSRSAESVDVHLERIEKTGSTKFMENYYVGYNHKSIADCGSTTLFIEGVSLLAAKAIQDWPLYSGQETSTRYIDMGQQPIVDPISVSDDAGQRLGRTILDTWMGFYTSKQDQVGDILRRRYPKRENEKQETYDRAIKARTFDVLRGFLPAGVTTQLSWHTNLRQAGDHLEWLMHHPALEIRTLAPKLRALLAERYSSSGFDRSMAAVSGVASKNDDGARRQEWERRVAEEFTYSAKLGSNPDPMHMTSPPHSPVWPRYAEMLATRPRGCVLPHFMTDLGQYSFRFLLDFGSFRDLQRHRNGVVRMPLLDTNWGFEKWYLEQLGDPENDDVGGLRDEAVQLIHDQQARILALPVGAVDKQYYTALGFQVPCQVTMALPALLYFLELRSGKTIHPTLRKQVHAMIRSFQASLDPHHKVALHVDMDPDDWDVRRGEQTITEKR